MCLFVAQSCPTLCNPMESIPPNPLSMEFYRQDIGVDSHSLLWGIFLTLGSNPGLLHCRQFFTIWATRETKDSKIICSVLSHVWLLVTPWIAAHQASPPFNISQKLLNLMSIESVMPSKVLNYGQWIYWKK